MLRALRLAPVAFQLAQAISVTQIFTAGKLKSNLQLAEAQEQPDLAQGPERWIVVRTQEGEERARATVQRQAERDQVTWEQRLWHLGNRPFACQPDAEAALTTTCQRLPPWFVVAWVPQGKVDSWSNTSTTVPM